MDKLEEFLKYHSEKIPELLEYINPINNVRDNLKTHPDVAIEACKSLFDSISKFVLIKLDAETTVKQLNKQDSGPLFNKALEKLSELNDKFEVDFTGRSRAIMHVLIETRNRRGEISHGKLYPKEENSTDIFAELVADITESIILYILHSFMEIDFSAVEIVKYEDNQEFNEYLDETEQIDGIIYSKALYDQDYTKYNELLYDYNLEKEDEQTT